MKQQLRGYAALVSISMLIASMYLAAWPVPKPHQRPVGAIITIAAIGLTLAVICLISWRRDEVKLHRTVSRRNHVPQPKGVKILGITPK